MRNTPFHQAPPPLNQNYQNQSPFSFSHNRMNPSPHVPNVNDLEKQMFSGSPMGNIPQPQFQKPRRNPFFASMSPSPMQPRPINPNENISAMDPMSRMRMMPQRQNEQMQNQPFSLPVPQHSQNFGGSSIPFEELFRGSNASPMQKTGNLFPQNPMHPNMNQPGHSQRLESQMTGENENGENLSANSLLQTQSRPVVVSDVSEDSELFDEPELFKRAEQVSDDDDDQETQREEDLEDRVIPPPPPPDPNRTGVYLTSRSKRILGKLTDLNARKENRINQTIVELLDSLRPSKEEERRKIDLLDRLQRLVTSIWPEHSPKLFLYGSAANNFALKKHDVDICLTIDSSVGTKAEIIQLLANSLPNDDAEEVNPLVW
eukprot:CAMPEP_0117038526 /NCGR_PEP_ID=MMETSP0472-20121206/27097_1 /TAXON_ID=693140 ORGANISM="Tiarina fusus, Strain LIS" /NCGR_SAMPLE_ID=MMETSP0472 /ASSEMBLY_ACC=CAM_ASM_000603 /LENGTH=373 /DNA_ID=CAMNT_0004748765 /DNA_START=207 /DNA_END=1325 /DNA_ORIENTATION=+